MTDISKFIEDFKHWAGTASLPELDYALSVVLIEVAARGPLALRYVRDHTADALLDLLAPPAAPA